ncbi:MAG TPA: phosphatidate cytidylyltransferase [Actinomycetota bacterium]|nr:phosphatidate cytidylyltransferase [Actinomycetota bacterium]
MPEDEERGQGEQLFEDLDKFFAPIQDVDWPESTDDRSAETGSRAAPRPEETAGSEAEQPLRIQDVDEDETETSSVGQEDVFASPPTERDEPNDDADGVSAHLLESEADDDDAITREALSRAPGAYVDLPGPDENDDEPVVAELDEPSAATDRAPDLESVEAAADRFAASVRDEVNVGAPSGATEEIQIAALLGDEEDEEVEPARVEASRTVRLGSEGLGGPSWQEPTALEVGADTERVSAGRDVPMAFLTGLVLTVLALGAIAIGPGPFAVVASILVLLAQGEFYFALQKRHYQPATALGLAAGALMLGAAYYRGEAAMLVVLALTVVATFLWYMTVPPPHRRNVVSNIGLTLLGVAYIPLLAGYALAVLELTDGRALALSIIGLTVAYDIAAFVVGTWWGSRPLAPNISPKKSWEGAIGATFVVAAIAIGAVAPAVGLLDTIPASVGLAVVVSIFAPLGDLAESLLKRDLDLKDMGGVLPGHGGVLDRIDALLFVAPAAFMYLRVLLL